MPDNNSDEPLNDKNEDDFYKVDLALWRALQKSTTLISSGRLITNEDTGKDEITNNL